MTARRRSRRTLTITAVLLALVALACTEPQPRLLAPAEGTTTEATTTTTAPDYSSIPLQRLPGETTTTAFLESGRSAVRGTVLGPEGPVPGALVRIDRLVGDAVQRRDVASNGNGRFAVEGVPGGRYRVRAFLPPRLTMTDPAIFFLPDGEGRDIDLPLGAFGGVQVASSTNPSAPNVPQDVSLAVRVTQQAVDGDGVVRQSPLIGIRVRIRSSGWVEVGPTVTTTDGGGVAVFQFRCERVGAVSATAVIGEEAPEPEPDDDGGNGNATTATSTTTAPAGSGFQTQTVSLDVPACSPRVTTTTAPADEGGDSTTTTEG